MLVSCCSGQLLFSDCMVHLYFSHSPTPRPQTCYLSPDTFLLVTSSDLRRESTMHCLQTLLYLSALIATQRKVCNAKGRFCTRTSSHLCKWFFAFECLLVWHYEERKKEKKKPTNSKLWPYYYYYYYYYSYYYYSNTSGIVLYLWMQTLSYICKILHCINFSVF